MTDQDKVQHALAAGRRRARAALERYRGPAPHRDAAIGRVRAAAPTALTQPPAVPAELIARAGAPAHGHLVAEGDSWFDYPGPDILDLLEDNYGFDVHSVAHRGDRIEDMAYMDGQLDDLKRLIERLLRNHIVPQAILISGCGNDIAIGDFGLFLNHADAPNPGLNPLIAQGIIDDRCRYALITILSALSTLSQGLLGQPIPVVVHGYDYPVPDGRGFGGWLHLAGPWLEPGFREKGINDIEDRKAIAKQLIDEVNAMIGDVATLADFTAFVRYVDLRNTLSTDPADYKDYWDNELHPTTQGFTLVTDRIAAVL